MAMALAVLFLVRVPKVVYADDTYQSENEEIISKLTNLWWMMLGVHLFSFSAMMLS